MTKYFMSPYICFNRIPKMIKIIIICYIFTVIKHLLIVIIDFKIKFIYYKNKLRKSGFITINNTKEYLL